MGKINRLENSLIDKIAAGEVIVRPASVVKELVENSIDAGSTRIRVEIANSTRDISIIDDGSGIAPEDSTIAFERHATSKISQFDDLEELTTRGFRGEALASIASVSKVEMTTRPHDSISGYRIQIEGGKIISEEPAGCPAGTTMHIRSLFYNTPARLKFLKSELSELNLITQTLTSQALSSPQIGFTMTNNNKPVFELPPDQSLKERIVMLLGAELKENLIEVKKDGMPVFIHGYIAKPEASKKDRRAQLFFVENRPVISKTLNYCVDQAFAGLMMTKRFPVCVLFIKLNPGEVDVNVHPTKTEVRFRDERLVSSLVYHSVREALQKATLIPEMKFEPLSNQNEAGKIDSTPKDDSFDYQSSDYKSSGSDNCQSEIYRDPSKPRDEFDELIASKKTHSTVSSMQDFSPQDFRKDLFKNPDALLKKSFDKSYENKNYADINSANNEQYKQSSDMIRSDAAKHVSMESLRREVHPEPFSPDFGAQSTKSIDSSEVILEELWNSDLIPEPLGQIDDTYIAASIDNNLLLIDQHAAHERINYNKLKERFKHQTVAQQNLLIPISFDVKITDVPVISMLLPFLKELGFEISPFGGATFSIQSLPVDIKQGEAANLINDILEDMKNEKDKTTLENLRDKIITRAACRCSVKAGEHLTHSEMKQLLKDLKNTHLSFTCPHGRPTMIILTRKQLDKQFKRIVT